MFVLIRTSVPQRRTFGHRFMQDCHSSLSKNELISFPLFGFAIKKFANVSVIKRNSKKVGYQGIFLKNVAALNKHAVMDWATTKLVPGTPDNILTKDEVWDCFKINHGISDEQHRE